MIRSRPRRHWLVAALMVSGIIGYSFMISEPRVDFITQVKPLLNRKCISCHGGVKQKAGYSLLFREEALGKGKSGLRAIIPGDPDNSELIRRLSVHDPEERMPYQEAPLSEDEIELLTRWVREGASWGENWSYTPVREVKPPSLRGWLWGLIPSSRSRWVRNDIDNFIAQKQEEQDLEPSPEADRTTLARRLSLDLTGLPPSPALTRSFLADTRPDAYQKLVDTLLASPAFGERWTAMWLDLARYADTKGYERDDTRNIWRYRDWLIRAFNRDMPYDSFLVEQMAGDMLPGATDEQLIATAFHRNTMTNDEGGTDNEEFRTAAVIDRVNTTWEVLLGTTFACVQCHSHPYDPFRQKDYYRFMAFLNDTRDEDTYAEYPLLHEFKGADSLSFNDLKNWLQEHADQRQAERVLSFLKTRQPAINSLTADAFVNSELSDTKWLVMRRESSSRLKRVELTGRTRLLLRYDSKREDGILTFRADSLTGTEIARFRVPKTTGGFQHHEVPLHAMEGVHDVYLQYHSPSLTNPDENGIRFDWFHFTTDFPGKGQPGYDSAAVHYRRLLDSRDVVLTPVILQNPADMHRESRIFEKGSWLVPGDIVTPGVPASLNPMPKGARADRLGLAQWLTSPDNPLTARTFVNRIWEQLFGTGLAETLEDLGTQGIPPTHPELLDHLAWNFMHRDGWSLKKLLRRIVLSATYRQDSRAEPDKLRKDPANRWLARGPRVRLSAEQVRDQALAVSGLLSARMYGRSVMPFQPEGIWLSPYNGRSWVKSPGEDQHRRAIYTFWKRTGPYPSAITFDGTAREVCLSRRIRTNTPLQALTTLNDPVFLEAARHLIYRCQEQHPNRPDKVIATAYGLATGYPLTEKRRQVLEGLYRNTLSRFQKDPEKACGMIGLQDQHNDPGTAALVVVGNAILNLDEVLNKN
jgi:hypothetical protein